MLLSVVMAAYNADKYIKEAIDSVLSQTYQDFEFIIVNDGSTDQTLSIIKSYNDSRIQIIEQANAGLSKSLNKGIALAKGKYIARMDADDICLKNRFKKQMDHLIVHPEIIVLGANANATDEENNFLYTTNVLKNINDTNIFSKFSPFIHSSVIFNKEIFKQCGGYPEDIIHHFEDLILWAKMFKYGKFANLTEPLINYRLNPSSITNKTKKAFTLQKKIARAYLNGKDINNHDLQRLLEMTKISPRKKKAMYHNSIAKIYLFKHFNKKKAIAHIQLSLKYKPFNLRALKLLIYSSIYMGKRYKNQNIQ